MKTTQLPKSIALLAQKGGVGKTTVAVSLAEWLSEHGQPVRLLDGNPGQQTLMRWAALRASRQVQPPLTVNPTFSVSNDRGRPRLQDHTADLLQAPYAGTTLLDLPGGIDSEIGPALRYCDVVLLPMPAMTFDYLSLTEVVALIVSARQVRKADGRKPVEVCLLLNKRGRSSAQDKIKHELVQEAGKLGIKVCKTELSYLSDFYASGMIGRSPVSFAPAGKAAQQIAALAQELELGR